MTRAWYQDAEYVEQNFDAREEWEQTRVTYRCERGCPGSFQNRDSRDAHHARGCSWDALVAELREAM